MGHPQARERSRDPRRIALSEGRRVVRKTHTVDACLERTPPAKERRELASSPADPEHLRKGDNYHDASLVNAAPRPGLAG